MCSSLHSHFTLIKLLLQILAYCILLKLRLNTNKKLHILFVNKYVYKFLLISLKDDSFVSSKSSLFSYILTGKLHQIKSQRHWYIRLHQYNVSLWFYLKCYNMLCCWVYTIMGNTLRKKCAAFHYYRVIRWKFWMTHLILQFKIDIVTVNVMM